MRSEPSPPPRTHRTTTGPDVFFVEARYHRDPSRVGAQVRYISHREEGLTDGRRRELYGLGDRYRAVRGDEQAIRNALREDARGLRNPVYLRFILTVDTAAAERFRRLDGSCCDRVVRDAIETAFHGAAPGYTGGLRDPPARRRGPTGASARARSTQPAVREPDGRAPVARADSTRPRALGAGSRDRPGASGASTRPGSRSRLADAVSSPARVRRRTAARASARQNGASPRRSARTVHDCPPDSSADPRRHLGGAMAPLRSPSDALAPGPRTCRSPRRVPSCVNGDAGANAGRPVAGSRPPRLWPPPAVGCALRRRCSH
jgi:hypothetical protein